MSAKYTFLAWDTPVKNAGTKLALLQLANNADDNGFSFYSISKMAKACDMSERSFMRKIQELELMGVLVVERRSNRPSLYTLVGDEMGVTICHLQDAEVTDCHAEVTNCHAQGDKLSYDPNSTPNSTPNNKDLLSVKTDAVLVLEYMNESYGKNYKPTTKSHLENINARLNEGATVEECKAVIDFKYQDWKGTTQEQYFRPQTLFQPSKFDGYLAASKIGKPRNVNTIGTDFSAPEGWN